MKGFSLIEILIAIAISGIILAIAIPSYSQHVIRAERMQAEVALMQLAGKLEQYYTINNTYQNAPLEFAEVKHYRMEITSATDTSFAISAYPLEQQDKECATLSLKSNGEKGISGTGTIEECW
jgi:type IV pilus assembly protein PilE